MSATPEQDAMVSEIHIAASPERVFQALIDPVQVVQWWGQEGIYRCTQFAADVRVGGKWLNAGIGPDGGNFEISGEYLEVDPPRLLASTWIATWTGTAQTTVRWELIPKDGGTLVRICHSGFAAHPGLANSYRGWPRMLGWLRAFLQRKETVDPRAAP
jgi:uncharacterized protein YndB with AHSA1/START domain